MDQSAAGEKRLYNGIADCLHKTAKGEGVAALYNGFKPTVIGGIPCACVRVCIMHCDCVIVCVTNHASNRPGDVIGALRHLERAPPPRWVQCRRFSPYASCLVVTHVRACALSGADCVYGNTDKNVWWFDFAKLGVGAWNGIVSQTAAYPLDTIRRRIAIDGGPGQARLYNGMIDCARKIVAAEGFRCITAQLYTCSTAVWYCIDTVFGSSGLYLGCGVNAIKAMPSAAIQFFACA